MFGQPLRSRVPAHHKSFTQKWRDAEEDLDAKISRAKDDAKGRYDTTTHPLPPLRAGQEVRVQSPTTRLWDAVGVVVGIGRRRDYHIKMPSGRVWWRNRRFLRPTHTQAVIEDTAAQEMPQTKTKETRKMVTFATEDEEEEMPRRSKRLAIKPRRSYKV